MIVLDTLLWGGLRFVLNQVVEAVDAEMNDEEKLREELLAAQMRVELGEMTDAQFSELEAVILQRLREIRQAREQATDEPGDFKVTGIDAEVTFDNGGPEMADHRRGGPEMAPTPPGLRRAPAKPRRASTRTATKGHGRGRSRR